MLKQIFKKIIIYLLILESKLTLKKYKPKIVAITGNIGKTSAKDAIFTVLSSAYFVRKSEKSFNSEIGIPLTILGLPNGWSNIFVWIYNIFDGLKLIFLKNHYPKWLVLEIGADRPGDIEKISKWLKTDIVVITHLPEIPVHVEFFKSAEEAIVEKGHIMKTLKDRGVFVVNNDDKRALTLKISVEEKKIITYGFSNNSDIVASNEKIIYENNKPKGISFRVDYKGNSIPVNINGALGKQHIYPVLSAMAVGISQGLNIILIARLFDEHETPQGRMKIIDGISNSCIIDDSYNSSPAAAIEAINTLNNIDCGGRKIVVLGDMMELGGYSMEEHIKVGKLTGEIADILITVGVRAKYIAQGANHAGMKERNIFQCLDSESAGDKLIDIIEEGDTVLIKGSQSMRMEKVVEKIMTNPEKKYRLLVRQEEEWQNR